MKRTVLATAIAFSCAVAHGESIPRGKIRLELNDVISSKPMPVNDFTGRLAVDALIQSHPDPLFEMLEQRYTALLPFSDAVEELPEMLLADVTTTQRMRNRLRSVASNIAQYTPKISSSLSYDDINSKNERPDPLTDPSPSNDYTTAIASINPTFQYRRSQRKWQVDATYDYTYGQYFIDSSEAINDHRLDVNYGRKLARGNELTLGASLEDSHSRSSRGPVEDFNSSVEAEELDYKRQLVKVNYRHGTERDKSRYDVSYFNEHTSLDSGNFDYELTRNGILGKYIWQLRRRFALVADARYYNYDYDGPFRDNDHYRATFGANVVLGRRTRVSAALGYEQKKFSKAVADNSFGEPVWHASLIWAPRRRTLVTMETGREIYEFASLDRPIDTDQFSVQDWIKTAWIQSWSDDLSTETSYTYTNTDSEFRDNEEDVSQVALTAIYRATNRLSLAIDSAYTRQKSKIGTSFIRRTFAFRTDYSL